MLVWVIRLPVDKPAPEPLPGYRKLNPMAYCGYIRGKSTLYGFARGFREDGLKRFFVVFEPETSQALGFGFRTGFLGLLHMDVIQERLEREFQLELIATAPWWYFMFIKQMAPWLRWTIPLIFQNQII